MLREGTTLRETPTLHGSKREARKATEEVEKDELRWGGKSSPTALSFQHYKIERVQQFGIDD